MTAERFSIDDRLTSVLPRLYEKVRDSAPVSRSIGVPSWVPDVKYTPRRKGAGSSLDPPKAACTNAASGLSSEAN